MFLLYIIGGASVLYILFNPDTLPEKLRRMKYEGYFERGVIVFQLAVVYGLALFVFPEAVIVITLIQYLQEKHVF